MPADTLSLSLLIAIPVMVLLTVWTVVTLVRVLFPERFSRRKAGTTHLMDHTKMILPVRSRDIVEDRHRQAAQPMEEEPQLVEEVRQELEPLFGDLWLRRN